MFRQSKGYQYAGVNKGRLKEYVVHASAVKINCKSFCEVGYTRGGKIAARRQNVARGSIQQISSNLDFHRTYHNELVLTAYAS